MRNTHKQQILWNQKGLSIIEGLVAAAIVATTAVGTAGLMNYVGRQSRRAQTLNRAITVQSTLVNALMNKAQYATTGGGARAAKIAQMAVGGSASNLEILAEPEKGALSPVLAIVGNRVGYGLDSTDSSTCPGSDCPIWVDMDISCAGLATQGCRAAYRITIAQNPADPIVVPAPLGAGPGPASANPRDFGAFPNQSDYTLPLSYDFFTQRQTADCGGDPENFFITGMSRSTGDLACIAKQAVECPYPQIAHGLAVEMVSGKRRLKLQCHDLANVQCPPEYVLQQMNFGQLDPGKSAALIAGGTMAGLRGICVYRWKTNIPWQGPAFRTASTSSAASYQARVCNTTYYDALANGGCNVAWDSNPPVTCPQTCYNYDVNGVPTSSYDCSYDIQASASVTYSAPSGADNIAQCSINVQQNSCSGGTTSGSAHGEWSGTCQVKERIPNPSLKRPPLSGVMGP